MHWGEKFFLSHRGKGTAALILDKLAASCFGSLPYSIDPGIGRLTSGSHRIAAKERIEPEEN